MLKKFLPLAFAVLLVLASVQAAFAPIIPGYQVGRTATLVVAASDSTARSKVHADYVCDGTADEWRYSRRLMLYPIAGGKSCC